MPPTDTSEKALESLIVASLTGQVTAQPAAGLGISEGHGEYRVGDYVQGDPGDFDRDHALDLAKLLDFLRATQPEIVEQFALEEDGPRRGQFLARLQGEIAKRGVIDVLRKGIKHGPAEVRLFYGMPTPGNTKAAEQYAANVFSVTRQLRYSKDETRLALDLALFINGLPLATFELKNNLTKQTYQDAITQYKQDRDPRETLFKFGVCAVHFALDDQQVWMCTALQGPHSWFIPFNKGYHDGAGNPPNSAGLKTDYLWKEVLARDSLTNILENYAQIVEGKDAQGKKKRRQVFPRYHQLDVVRKLLSDARANGAGRRYLIQHSAGSGKSNSIAWLAHQLVPLKQPNGMPVFDSVIVVTDRRVLDKQIRDTIRQFAQVSSVVGAAEHSGDLRQFLQSGKKIVITTVQKFPIILTDIGNEHRGQRFAIIIDEAHSSQGGRTSAKMNEALSPIDTTDQDEDTEDRINRLIASKKMLPNASYFAFTATPKNKTLELFGERVTVDGAVMPRPFHVYSMKQAIQEGFIFDVLQNYTPVNSYYRLIKKVEADPEFDTNRAQKKLRHYVESHQHAIRQKAEIMVDHFHEQVARRIDGKARAMVVTNGIDRAIQYFHAFDAYLRERKSPYRAIVAFSGEHQDGGRGVPVTEASLNGFPSAAIPDQFIEEPYRFLIVADKFQTGYDEPLLHTMYVDKQLSDIKAVQTLSRLNRSCPGKTDTFVLDFLNDLDIIQLAFDRYYRTTILSGETDPNKLHDLKGDLDGYQVYAWDDVESLVQRYLAGANRDQLDPILDGCVAVYIDELDEDGQIDFKSKAKAFLRAYNFLATILPFNSVEWEELSIFLNFLVPKLPAPIEDDLSRGILETIDMDSYRVEVKKAMAITLQDDDTVIDPIPTSAGGFAVEPELDRLSNIVKAFNDQFGNIEWKNRDKIEQVITEELPAKVAADQAYQNAIAHSDKQNARIEHDRALKDAVVALFMDHSELYQRFEGDSGFKKWLSDTNFNLTYQPPGRSSS